MKVMYKLTKHLLGRNAAQLVHEMNQINCGISIYRKEQTTCINAKSFVGVLAGYYKGGDIITIYIDNAEYESRVKEIFNEYGKELEVD